MVSNLEVDMKKQDILQIVLKTLEDNKAEDVVQIDLQGKTSIADHMVVATGNSQRHVAAVAEYVYQALKDNGFKSVMEGQEKADWVLIDAYDVIVHIFRAEVREFYNIEKMWSAVAEVRKK